jgi:hypothetical protein
MLPKAEREFPEWETAIEWLMRVGEHGGDPMLPRISMMKALRRHELDMGLRSARLTDID